MTAGAVNVHSVTRSVNGLALHALEAGEGPSVVLLHPEPGDASTFSAILPLLARDHHVVALDVRGHGRSAKPRGDYSVPAQARYVEAFLDAAGIDRPVLVGNSYGGILALYLAGASPARVRGLVLAGTNAYRAYRLPWKARALASWPGRFVAPLVPRAPIERAFREQFADPDRAPAQLVRAVSAAMADREWRRCLWSQAHALDFGAVEARLSLIEAPTLLVWGAQDEATDLGWARRLAGDIRHAHLEIVDGCGHYPPVEQPEVFATLTRAFVAGLPPDVSRHMSVPGPVPSTRLPPALGPSRPIRHTGPSTGAVAVARRTNTSPTTPSPWED
jgi:pimeloyl-ACP methyl ester carboxylesterase